MRKKGIKVFVQLSSLPVIGKPVEHPITEQHSLKPPTVYHATKVMEELLANYADYHHGLRTASFRISAPVGTGMNRNTIFPTFVSKACKGEDLVLSGKGNRKQTYVHVRDISKALLQAIESEKHMVYIICRAIIVCQIKNWRKHVLRYFIRIRTLYFQGRKIPWMIISGMFHWKKFIKNWVIHRKLR